MKLSSNVLASLTKSSLVFRILHLAELLRCYTYVRRCAKTTYQLLRGLELATLTVLIIGVSGQNLAGQDLAKRPENGDKIAEEAVDFQPRRSIKFRTTEGTWMSLDIAPDGQTIVFALLGDIYLLPIRGGKAQQLTSGLAYDDQPRFSPDGTHIAFISDRSGFLNLWTMDRNGKNFRQISNVLFNEEVSPIGSPVWSPDGKSIIVSQRLGAFVDDPNDLTIARTRWQLARYDIDSKQMRWLTGTTPTSQRDAIGPAVDPDGKFLYAAFRPYVPAREISQPTQLELYNFWRIERFDIDRNQIFPVEAPSLGRGGMRPVLSRDGKYLAYVSASGSELGLRLFDLHSYKERWLVPAGISGNGEPYDFRDLSPGYAFTPDSKAIVIAYNGKIHKVNAETGVTTIIPFEVDVDRELLPMKVHQFKLPGTVAPLRGVMQPALAPNGDKVAFSALNHIWILDLVRTEAPKRLTNDSCNEFYPSWSPDGKWIAYSTWEDGQGGSLRRIRVPNANEVSSTSSEVLAGDPSVYFHTAFSPDGKYIAVVKSEVSPERVLTHNIEVPKNLTLNIVPSQGGNIHKIVDLSAEIPHASRLPIEEVYFTNDSQRVFVGLTSWRMDGSDKSTALNIFDDTWALPELNDVSGMISPDGRRALVTHRHALSEVFLPSSPAANAKRFNLEEAQSRAFGSDGGAASRWGAALAPWLSWSSDGKTALFSQGGIVFVGALRPDGWTSFKRVEVPLAVECDKPTGRVLLSNARLVTMRGNEVIEHGSILVKDGRIAAVGAVGEISRPADTKVVDLAGKTIIPGYVDIHDHFEIPAGVHSTQVPEFLVRLAYGVTAFRDPYEVQMRYNDMFAFQDLERAGSLISPRIFSTGIAHISSTRIPTFAAAKEVVTPTAEFLGAETFKEYSDGSRQEHQRVAQAADELGLNATVHSCCVSHLTNVIDGFTGIEHSFGTKVYDDVATLVAKSGTTLTNTYILNAGAVNYIIRTDDTHEHLRKFNRFIPPSLRNERWNQILDSYENYGGMATLDESVPELENAALVSEKGGNVAVGAHGNFAGIGFHYEMWLYALGGMRNHDILRSATIVGATAIGHANDFGSLEVGKLADLQVLDKNPLEDIHNSLSLRYVMKNGHLYNAEDLTEIWPTQRSLPPIYSWNDPSSAVSTAAQR